MKSDVLLLLNRLRDGFETERAEFYMPTLRSFPSGSCDWISVFIMTLLTNSGMGAVRRMRGFRTSSETGCRSGHSWTVIDDHVLDITGDQFPDCPQRVIYGKSGDFHQSFSEKRECDFKTIDDYQMLTGLQADFARVCSWLHSTGWNHEK